MIRRLPLSLRSLPLAPRPRALSTAFAVLILTAVAALPAPALAESAPRADGTLYWTQQGGLVESTGLLLAGSLAGGEPRTLLALPPGSSPEGVALDPAAGEVYWTDRNSGRIFVARLTGGAAATTIVSGQSAPLGLALDKGAGRIYWTDESSGRIMSANLYGGEVRTLYAGEQEPAGIAIDAATGGLFWTDKAAGTIRQGLIGGAGESEAKTLYEGEHQPSGIALDSASGRLYWNEAQAGQVRAGGIGGEGEGGARTLFAAQQTPVGIALDPATGTLYWADHASGTIDAGAIAPAGTGGAGAGLARSVFAPGAEGPNFLALLSAPEAVAPPSIAGKPAMNETLICSAGTWAEDDPGASFYQAPESISYRWLRDGVPVVGADNARYVVGSGGSYVCEVTAANAAGSTAQSTAPVSVPAPTSPPLYLPVLTIEGRRVVVRRGRAGVTLTCNAGRECEGTLSLLAEVRRRIRKGRARHRRRVIDTKGVTLAQAHYRVPSGASGEVKLRLTSHALKMLADAYGHRLEVWAVAMLTPGKVTKPLLIALSHEGGRGQAQGRGQGRHRRVKGGRHQGRGRRRHHAQGGKQGRHRHRRGSGGHSKHGARHRK